jgi:hypothetical protein
MAKFIQVNSSTEGYSNYSSYYVNVETVRFVAQTQTPNRSMLRFVGDDISMPIDESAASFVSRAGAD